jgi:hypothetical protein
MSEQQSERPAAQQADPFAQWLAFWDNWTKTWSEAASDVVASKSFADSMSQQLEGSMDAMALVRRQVSEIMEQYLRQMSLPTRSEVLSLAERITRMEMTLDDVEAKIDEALDLLKAQPAPTKKK